jgi:hypothetical protein
MDRRLLAKLSQCAWKVLNLYLTQAVPYDDTKAGAAVAVQSFEKDPQIRRRRTQIDLKLQLRRKKLILTTKPALVNRMIIDCINGCLNMLGCS